MRFSLKQLDIEFMRRLHTRVNLIPVIAKADTLTDEEIADFKARVSCLSTTHSSLTKLARRSLQTSLTTIFTSSRHLAMRTKMKKPWLRLRKSLARFLLLLSVPTMSWIPLTDVKSVGVPILGVSLKSTMRNTVISLSFARCSSEPTWRSLESTRMTSCMKTGEARSSSAWALLKIPVSSGKSSKCSFWCSRRNLVDAFSSPSAKIQEERVLHEAKLSKMEAEMKMVFQQKVQEKESKLKQSEEELYARHKEMKDALDKQRADLEDKKRRIESGRPLTPEKNTVSESSLSWSDY